MTSSSFPRADRNRVRLRYVLREQFLRLPIVAPPPTILEPALEYPRTARFVALYLVGEELRADDGMVDEGGCALAFAALCASPSLAPALRAAQLGLSAGAASDALLLDRADRRLYLARKMVAVQYVNTQDHTEAVPAAWIPDAVRAAAVPPGQRVLFPVDTTASVIDLDARRQRTTDLVRWLAS